MQKSPGELFIVDNSDEWTTQRYLQEWCDVARAFDIATGYFEIGSLLALDEQWQNPQARKHIQNIARIHQAK